MIYEYINYFPQVLEEPYFKRLYNDDYENIEDGLTKDEYIDSYLWKFSDRVVDLWYQDRVEFYSTSDLNKIRGIICEYILSLSGLSKFVKEIFDVDDELVNTKKQEAYDRELLESLDSSTRDIFNEKMQWSIIDYVSTGSNNLLLELKTKSTQFTPDTKIQLKYTKISFNTSFDIEYEKLGDDVFVKNIKFINNQNIIPNILRGSNYRYNFLFVFADGIYYLDILSNVINIDGYPTFNSNIYLNKDIKCIEFSSNILKKISNQTVLDEIKNISRNLTRLE